MKFLNLHWVIVIIALTAFGCAERAATTTPAGKPVDPPDAPVRIKDPTDLSQIPDFQMTAEEYHVEWQKDAIAARAKFTWKLIELGGIVTGFRSQASSSFVELAVKGQERTVWCFTTDKRPWNQVSDGQTVKIRGQFNPSGDSFGVHRCVIVEATGPKSAPLTAAQLGAELDADAAAATAKYKRKGLVVTGTVEKKVHDGKFTTRILFQGGSDIKIYAEAISLKPDWTEKIQPGDTIRFLGSFGGLLLKKEFVLESAVDAGP